MHETSHEPWAGKAGHPVNAIVGACFRQFNVFKLFLYNKAQGQF